MRDSDAGASAGYTFYPLSFKSLVKKLKISTLVANSDLRFKVH